MPSPSSSPTPGSGATASTETTLAPLSERWSKAWHIMADPWIYVSRGNVTYLLLAMAVYHYWLPLDEATGLLQDGAAWHSHLPWMASVLLRNVALGFVVYSVWHYLLYTRQVARTKFNPRYPPVQQHQRDRKWTMLGLVIGSAFEIAMVLCYATGRLRHSSSPWPAVFTRSGMMPSLRFYALWVTACFWSDVHFYMVHRLIHPWNVQLPLIGDPGRFLYKKVHYLHHRSPNPGPWAGLAMHPVEHLLYFSRTLIVLVGRFHPIIMLFINIRAMIGPAPGHHGFGEYMGSRFHYLHHARYACNYGTRGALDILFGTYMSTETLSVPDPLSAANARKRAASR